MENGKRAALMEKLKAERKQLQKFEEFAAEKRELIHALEEETED
jgi:hypothetical protein